MKNKDTLIGISIGDPNGIGCEVILKTFSDKQIFDFCTPVLFASPKLVETYRNHLGISVELEPISNLANARCGVLNIIDVWDDDFRLTLGTATKEGGRYALMSLRAATEALKSGSVHALVTAPISKEHIQSDVFSFPGHTDYLEYELGGKSLMFMVSDKIRVGLFTDHIALKNVVDVLSQELIAQKLKTINHSLKMDFGIAKPKIAVLGINPHAGDGGVIGHEDDTILKPALKSAFDKGIFAFGPYPADSFFGSNSYQKFDAIIASYHDQGLIPFKTLTFGEGVNYTAGLPKVRTSPDHGTAFAIAGKNEANPSSFKAAVYKAIGIVSNRARWLRSNQVL